MNNFLQKNLNVIKAIGIGLAICVLSAGSAWALFSEKPQTEAAYEAYEKERQRMIDVLLPQREAILMQLSAKDMDIAQSEILICRLEAELAKAKLADYHNGFLSLPIDEIERLTAKMNQSCGELLGEPPRTAAVEGNRLDDFLAKNGANFLKEAGDVFRQVGDQHKIKPEVLICIAQADSSLGKALKTANNIGNVGNNDRGDAVHYPNLRSGIEAIAITLNNQYLGSYVTVGQLSRGGGNRNGKVYATSEFNWNRNVIKCLSQLTGAVVDESFNFRK